jgi:hypothetical protein
MTEKSQNSTAVLFSCFVVPAPWQACGLVNSWDNPNLNRDRYRNRKNMSFRAAGTLSLWISIPIAITKPKKEKALRHTESTALHVSAGQGAAIPLWLDLENTGPKVGTLNIWQTPKIHRLLRRRYEFNQRNRE